MPVSTTTLDEELLSSSLYMADSLATGAAVSLLALAAIPATGADVVLDESSGLQNGVNAAGVAGDLDDNDILLSSLPTVFSTRLAALPGTGTAIGAALSGYNGGNAGLDAFAISAGTATVTDVKFVHSDGNPLNGQASGLSTVLGQSILLYTDATNNNIVLGRVGSATGDIAFAAYIEETLTAGKITGGKIWMVQYDPLLNPNTGNPDDAIDLSDKVFVGVDQDASFSLAGAPSGQNLFLMFTTATPTTFVDGLGVTRIADVSIIATGKDPVIGANGQFTNTSDTINTSQAGGPTTFGTNSQMIVEQEGVRFTYVSGARQNVTIPNLDQNEADVEANADFTAYFGAHSGQFDVVQLQSGKSAQVKVTAINNVGDGAGTLFVDGYADDATETVGLSRLQVIDTATGAVLADSTGSPSANGLVITLATGLITGVKAGQTIVYTTVTDHNRVLVENGAATNASGNTHADFDIGGFKLLQQTSTIIEVGSKMIFEDDGPNTSLSGATNPGETGVDESDLPGAATSNFGFSDFFVPGTASGGTDGGASVVTSLYTIALVNPAGADTGLVDTLSGDKIYLYQSSSTTLVGRVGADDDGGADQNGAIAFTITINTSTGAGTLTQSRSVVHGDTGNPDDTVTMGANLFTVTRVDTVTDAEGDSFSTPPTEVTVGVFFNFEDDGPSVTLSAAPTPTLTTDDTEITDTAGPVGFASLFNVNFGNDSFKDANDDNIKDADAVTYALGVSAPNVASGLTDTLSGDAIVLSLESGVVYGRVGAGGLEVFRVSVNSDTGAVTLVQSRSVVHNDSTDPVESGASAAGLAAALVTLTATATDGDGDQASATKNIGDAFKFEDDGPSISANANATPQLITDDTDIPDTAGPTSFAGLFTSAFGNDGFKDSNDDDIEDADALGYALGINAGATGLVDTLSADAIVLSLESGVVYGRVGAGGLEAFRISVNADTGAVTLVQSRSVVHKDPADPVEGGASAAGLAAANLVTLTATVVDGDGDSASATRNIGDAFKFEDDGPSISANANATPPLVTDDTDIPDTAGPTSFAGLFTSAFGKDGFKDSNDDDVEDADALGYALGINGSATGLVDTLSADAIVLSLETGIVYGRVGAGGAEAFRISVNADTGAVTLVQSRSVVHNDPADPVESGASAAGLNAANLVTLTATVVDGDGDSASATRNIGDAFKFEDDGPSISANANATPQLITDDTDIPDTAGPTSFAGLFTSAFGKDGFKDSNDDDVEDADALGYALGINVGATGLADALTGTAIVLSVEAGVVYGRVGAGGTEALRISVNADSGAVTLVQSRSVVHNDPADPVESGASAAGFAAANLVTLTATIVDGDGDSASATRNIADAFKFEDDGPSVSPNAAVQLDDDALAGGNAGGTGDDADAANIGGTLGHVFGKDGGSVAYLDTGAPAGFSYVPGAGGSLLVKQGTTTVLTLTLNAATGAYTVAQNAAILHAAGSAENNQSFTINYRVTDGDLDTADGTLVVNVDDDTPTLAFGNLVGTGTDLPQFGYWSKSVGADGPNLDDLQIALTGFQLAGQPGASSTFVETAASPDGSFNWNGTLTGDFDANGVTPNTTVAFTLKARLDGTYVLDLATPVASSTTTDTANGALGAGGPDPVQTLTIPPTPTAPGETVVFFSAKVGASFADIGAGIIQDLPDPTEASLQGPPLAAFIDPRNMNVSTSGIGVANNLIEGDANAAIGGIDESIVINPGTLVNTVRVFVDNSVAGYKYTPGPGSGGNERMFYTVYFSDGTRQENVEVNFDINTDNAAPKFFDIVGGTKTIDAVQITMAKGDVKIPNIQFITITESLANDISLDFLASLTDKDGDTASSAFSADLFTNKPANAPFDFELAGSAGAADAFDIDLASLKNDYQVTGWNAGDKLVLIGNPGAVVGAPANGGPNSIVTVTETGGQVTTITVVGVDLVPADIVFGT